MTGLVALTDAEAAAAVEGVRIALEFLLTCMGDGERFDAALGAEGAATALNGGATSDFVFGTVFDAAGARALVFATGALLFGVGTDVDFVVLLLETRELEDTAVKGDTFAAFLAGIVVPVARGGVVLIVLAGLAVFFSVFTGAFAADTVFAVDELGAALPLTALTGILAITLFFFVTAGLLRTAAAFLRGAALPCPFLVAATAALFLLVTIIIAA